MARGRASEPDAATERVERIERQHVEELARAHAALAAAQERSYWLDRWGVDLNALMRRPGARRARAGLRALREVKRAALALRRYVDARLREQRQAAAEDELAGGGQAADRDGSRP